MAKTLDAPETLVRPGIVLQRHAVLQTVQDGDQPWGELPDLAQMDGGQPLQRRFRLAVSAKVWRRLSFGSALRDT